MRSKEVADFWIPAMERIFSTGSNFWRTVDNAHQLDRALGVMDYHDFWISKLPDEDKPLLSEDLKRVLIMLAGPHSKSVLKAYRIVKGLEP